MDSYQNSTDKMVKILQTNLTPWSFYVFPRDCCWPKNQDSLWEADNSISYWVRTMRAVLVGGVRSHIPLVCAWMQTWAIAGGILSLPARVLGLITKTVLPLIRAVMKLTAFWESGLDIMRDFSINPTPNLHSFLQNHVKKTHLRAFAREKLQLCDASTCQQMSKDEWNYFIWD